MAGFFYALAQTVLPAGRPGRYLARGWLSQALWFSPHHDRARAYLDYLQGVRAMEAGDPDEALRLLRRAAKALPADPAVLLDAGVAMTIGGEWQAAESTLSGLLRDHPRRMRGERQLWFALAWSQLRLGRARAALETARQAAEAGSGTPGLHLVVLLAQLSATGALDAPALARLLRTQPALLTNVLEYAEQAAESQQASRADLLLSALPPDLLPHGLRLIAASALNGDRLEAARWALARWEATGADPARRLVLESELRLREQQPAAAVAAARAALEQQPGSAAAEEQLGEALLLSGRLEEAYGPFVEALAAGSPSALAAGVVALHLLEEGRHQDARQVFRRGRVGGALGCALAHAASGRLLLEAGNLPEALALATQSWQAYQDLPGWAGQPAARDLALSALQRLLDDWLLAAEQTGHVEDLPRARKLRREVAASRS
jgi:tetratricopeptide (TPR) repeat protein